MRLKEDEVSTLKNLRQRFGEDADFSHVLASIVREQDLHTLGQGNLAALIARLRSREGLHTLEISRLMGNRDVLVDLESDIAKEVDFSVSQPQLIGMRPKDRAGIDIVSAAYGSTTYQHCTTSCKHSRGSTGLGLVCALLPDYQKFGSPCAVRAMSPEERAHLLEPLGSDVSTKKRKREAVRRLIKAVQQYKEGAPDRPLLPNLRRGGYFLYGDRFAVYLRHSPAYQAEQAEGAGWVGATMLRLDGNNKIWLRLDRPVLNGDLFRTPYADVRTKERARTWVVAYNSPYLLHLADFDCLRYCNDMFRQAWWSMVRQKASRVNDEYTKEYVQVDLEDARRACSPSAKVLIRKPEEQFKRVPPGDPNHQLMDALTAVQQLFGPDDAVGRLATLDARSAPHIVEAFRKRSQQTGRAKSAVHWDRVAKDTLLIRIHQMGGTY